MGSFGTTEEMKREKKIVERIGIKFGSIFAAADKIGNGFRQKSLQQKNFFFFSFFAIIIIIIYLFFCSLD